MAENYAASSESEVVLRVHLWASGAPESEVPPSARAMVSDLLSTSGCVVRDELSDSLEAGFQDAVLAFRAARQLQRLIRGYCSAAPAGCVGGYIVLSNRADVVSAADLPPQDRSTALNFAEPAKVLVAGALCESARLIPGLRFEAEVDPLTGLEERERRPRLLRLLPAAEPAEEAEDAPPAWRLRSLGSGLPDFNALMQRRWIFLGGGAAAALILLAVQFGVSHRPHDAAAAGANTPASDATKEPATDGGAVTLAGKTSQPGTVVTAPEKKGTPSVVATPDSGRSGNGKRKGQSGSDGNTEPKPEKEIKTGGLGFTDAEIKDLIARADRDSGDGNFGKAILEYQTALKYEPSNAQAKEGLQRAIRNRDNQ